MERCFIMPLKKHLKNPDPETGLWRSISSFLFEGLSFRSRETWFISGKSAKFRKNLRFEDYYEYEKYGTLCFNDIVW
eukprot:snap_masked-scaffold_30-processed-gene-0.20-mRNA-1 protein AED:1.00 eAED:1.00 QI:0/0/0/0/1/1/2/0/76